MPPDDRAFDPADRSQYELVRAKHVIVPLSPLRKARLCAAVALLGALAAPLVATLPVAVREAAFSGTPTLAPLGVAAIVLFGTLAAGVGGFGLVALQWWLGRAPEPSDDAVWNLIAAEDAFSGIGLVTGGLGVGVGLALLASGHWGPAALEGLNRNGIEPYTVLTTPPVTPRATTAAALVVGVAVLVATAAVARDE